MSHRSFNFSAGPAALPEPVLARARDEMMALPGIGASVLEISHRSDAFRQILAAAEANLRALLHISDDYRVLFLQGGSRLQFSMVPLNLRTDQNSSADYIVTGSWGKNALGEATVLGAARAAWDGASGNFRTVPSSDELDLDEQAAYVHFTSNETIEGVQFASEPEVGAVPLVCDASSDFLHGPVDVAKYGLIYACAQKNAGPAGVTIVVIRDDLLDRARDGLPGYLKYENHAAQGSLWNTAPTFAVYVVKLVTDWLLEEIGGLDKMLARNREKARVLYETIDSSDDFYVGHAHPNYRSLMNVTFRLPSDELTKQFIRAARERQLDALAGHRSVGGIRASIYNAMPPEGVIALRDFMVDFHREHAGTLPLSSS